MAGEQFAAAVFATFRAVFLSWLAPESIWRSTNKDSRTPPEQDSTSALSWCRKPRRSAARCPLVGRCESPTATATTRSAATAASPHRGMRRTGQPLLRTGMKGGSVLAVCI